MIHEIETALSAENYAEAQQLIENLDAQNPWRLLYRAQLQEKQQQVESAEDVYRQILSQGGAPKVVSLARQGLQRLRQQQEDERKGAIAAALSTAEQKEPGFLVLQAVDPERQGDAALHLAKVMEIDRYSARLMLPSHGIRLYRTGSIGELDYYRQQLQAEDVPCFAVSLAALKKINVKTVQYFTAIEHPRAHLVDTMHPDEPTFAFQWTDVQQAVTAHLPIFEEVVDLGPRGKLQRKEQTQDFVSIYDLHLLNDNCIVRIHDVAYHFNEGVAFQTEAQRPDLALQQKTVWANWGKLAEFLQSQIGDRPQWQDFEAFATNALDHEDALARLPAHLNLFRRAESAWDAAFMLYSSLLFWHQSQSS